MNKSKNRGITLIALVITIIVLILLAGLGLSMTVGEEGVLRVSKKLKENMIASEDEQQARINELYDSQAEYNEALKPRILYTVAGYEGVYTGDLRRITIVTETEEVDIEYSTDGGETWTSQCPEYANAGTYSVTFRLTKPQYKTAVGTVTIIIEKANINVTEPTPRTLTYDGTQQALVTAGSATYGTMEYSLDGTTYTSSIPKATNADTYSIYWRVLGGQNYNDVSGVVASTIQKAENTITLESYTGRVGCGTQKLVSILSNASGGALSATSSDVTVATAVVDGNILVMNGAFIEDDTDVVITITSAETSNYKSKSITYALTVELLELDYTATGYTGVYNGQPQKIIVTVNTPGATLTFSTDGEHYILTESPEYTNAGENTVYYKIVKPGYKSVSGSRKIVIEKADGTVTAPIPRTLVYDGTEQALVTAGTTTTGTIQYKLDNGTYGTNIPKAIAAGTYSIYYRVVGNQNYNDVAENVVTSTIQKADNTLRLSDTSGTVTYPNTGTFTITSNVSGGSLSVSSSDNNIATASLSGTTVTITPKIITADGTVTITVTSAATANYNAQTATYTAEIKQGIITVTANDYTGAYDGSAHGISVTASPAGCTIKYSTDGTTYNLDNAPTYTDASTHTTYYKVTKAGYKTVAGSKTVTIGRANSTLQLSAATKSLTYPTSGTITVTNNVSGGALSVSTSNSNIATASISGTTVTITPGTLAGEATITVTSAATTNYNAQTATCIVAVENGTITVTANNYTGTYDGTAHGITVTTDPADATVTYSEDGENYSSTPPTYTNSSTHTTYYKVTKTGYKTVSGSKTVTIGRANSTLILSATTGNVEYGTPYTFNVSNPSGGTITVTSSDDSIATATYAATDATSGVVTITAAQLQNDATATITISVAQSTNYNAASASFTATVLQAGYPAYEIGQEVYIGEEQFYVIGHETAEYETVTLLAKYALSVGDPLKQEPDLKHGYMNGNVYTSNYNCISIKYNNSTIDGYVNNYATKFFATGSRLPESYVSNLPSRVLALNTTSGESIIYWIKGTRKYLNNGYVSTGNNYTYGAIRPVLEINKSLVNSDHVHTGNWITVNEPTCTTEGTENYICSICGKTCKTRNIDALGHNYDYSNNRPRYMYKMW